jgi:hypothetical protein
VSLESVLNSVTRQSHHLQVIIIFVYKTVGKFILYKCSLVGIISQITLTRAEPAAEPSHITSSDNQRCFSEL